MTLSKSNAMNNADDGLISIDGSRTLYCEIRSRSGSEVVDPVYQIKFFLEYGFHLSHYTDVLRITNFGHLRGQEVILLCTVS